MTPQAESQLSERLRKEGKLKGLLEKRLDEYVATGIQIAKKAERKKPEPRPAMGEHARK